MPVNVGHHGASMYCNHSTMRIHEHEQWTVVNSWRTEAKWTEAIGRKVRVTQVKKNTTDSHTHVRNFLVSV